MLEILQISENGLKANQAWLNAISHNVANIQTPGFKKNIVNFGELVNNQDVDSSSANINISKGMGVAVYEGSVDTRQGDIKATGRMLDLAIDGSGFFEVELADGGYVYTRVGQLAVNAEGRLITQQGDYVGGGVIVPPDTEVLRIESDGKVYADFADSETMELGEILMVNFANPGKLKALGGDLFQMTANSGDPEPVVDSKSNRIMQGYMEMSNVDLIDEMSQLLLAQRAYQLNARLIQTADQIMETINNIRR